MEVYLPPLTNYPVCQDTDIEMMEVYFGITSGCVSSNNDLIVGRRPYEPDKSIWSDVDNAHIATHTHLPKTEVNPTYSHSQSLNSAARQNAQN